MIERHSYKTPPIEEALCEFRFEPGRDWDLTVPGKLQTQLSNKYSGKPQQGRVVEVELDTQKGTSPNLRYREGFAKVQLVTDDGKRMVGVGPDVLSIHMLRPYQYPPDSKASGWDEFKPRISDALEAYWEVSKPVGVRRIGIRYINKIIIPRKSVKVEEYLRCALPVVAGLPNQLNDFMSRVDYAYPDGVHLILSQGSVSAPADHVGFLLDLDVIWESPQSIVRDEALEKVNDLRIRERQAFENVITDKTRSLFDAD